MSLESPDQLLYLTKVKIEDKEYLFSNLNISMELADVTSFSFCHRPDKEDSSFASQQQFNKDILSKKVTISIGSAQQVYLTYVGIITSINCTQRNSDLTIEYEISGRGVFEKIDKVPGCDSFYKKDLSKIYNALLKGKGLEMDVNPTYTKELFYTVKYRQSTFDFYRMLASRHGEWLYYNGTKLILGKPTDKTLEVSLGKDLQSLYYSTKLTSNALKPTGYNTYKGEPIMKDPEDQEVSFSAPALATMLEASKNVWDEDATASPMHFPQAPTDDIITRMYGLYRKAKAARAIFVNGSSRNSQIALGEKIKVMDESGKDIGKFIIVEIHHIASDAEHYQNHFTAIPAENTVPPYTNPFLYPTCKPQPAIVIDNEDKDGLDRIRVRFPWQCEGVGDDTTPWLHVVTPYAGKGKGMRFIPEKDEDVMVGFIDDNAEWGYIMGAIHTEPNKSQNDYKGNNIKVLGSRTARRLEINEEKGAMAMADNYMGKFPINFVSIKEKDGTQHVKLRSAKDDKNKSDVILVHDESIQLHLHSGGQVITSIELSKDGKTINIKSKGKVNISADDSITMKAKKINIEASDKLSMKGSTGGVAIEGQKIEAKSTTSVLVEATADMNLRGLNTTVEGNVQLGLKGGAMAEIQAAIVKIN